MRSRSRRASIISGPSLEPNACTPAAQPQEPKRHNTRSAAASSLTKQPTGQPTTEHFHQKWAHMPTATPTHPSHCQPAHQAAGQRRKQHARGQRHTRAPCRELRGQAPHQEDMPVLNRQTGGSVVLAVEFSKPWECWLQIFGSCMVEQYLRLY